MMDGQGNPFTRWQIAPEGSPALPVDPVGDTLADLLGYFLPDEFADPAVDPPVAMSGEQADVVVADPPYLGSTTI